MLNWAAICIVPLVYPLFKDVVHHCPRCLRVLATRSRVMLPKVSDEVCFKRQHSLQVVVEVMSFRVGSCACVLARKYVFALLAMTTLIGGIHWLRSFGVTFTADFSQERCYAGHGDRCRGAK